MGRFLVALAASGFAFLGACHLADSPDPVTCGPGSHPSDGHCALDAVDAGRVTITPDQAGGCSVAPPSITVAPNAPFELKNDDSVDHVIAGADGQAWATVKAKQLSPLIGITKAGTFPYTVSGCAQGGTVVVE